MKTDGRVYIVRLYDVEPGDDPYYEDGIRKAVRIQCKVGADVADAMKPGPKLHELTTLDTRIGMGVMEVERLTREPWAAFRKDLTAQVKAVNDGGVPVTREGDGNED